MLDFVPRLELAFHFNQGIFKHPLGNSALGGLNENICEAKDLDEYAEDYDEVHTEGLNNLTKLYFC